MKLMRVSHLCFALGVVFAACGTACQGQETVQSLGLTWTVHRGDDIVETDEASLHLTQNKDHETTDHALVSAPINPGKTGRWRIHFEVKFGELRSQGVRIQIGDDQHIMGWVGSDGWYKAMGVFFGKDAEKYGPAADTEWHQFDYICNGNTLTIQHNGQKITEGPSQGVPDKIRIGAWGTRAAARLTEIWVRNLTVTGDDPGADSPSTQLSGVTDHFTDGPLPGLWKLKPNTGRIVLQGKELCFLPSPALDSFGVMTSREGLLPAGSSWQVQIRFRVPHIGPYGTGLAIEDPAEPKRIIFSIHSDTVLRLPQVILTGQPEFRLQNPSTLHDVRIENQAGRWTVWMDKQQIAAGEVPQKEYRLRFGADIEHLNPWSFSTLTLQSVSIRYTAGPRPSWLTGIVKAQLTAVDHSATTPSLFAGRVLPDTSAIPSLSSVPHPSGVGLVLGADNRTPAPAHPAADGHLVVTGRDTQVEADPGAFIEFAPTYSRPDFTPTMLYLLINRHVREQKPILGTSDLPPYVVDAPSKNGGLRQVQIIAVDPQQRKVELARCLILPTEKGEPSQCEFVLQGEQVRLQHAAGSAPKALFTFLEDSYLGCLTHNLDKFSVDARRLPVGQYQFRLVTETSDGVLLPPTSSLLTIQPRFNLTSSAQQGVFTVEAEKNSIPLHVSRMPGTDVKTTYVYVAGALVGQSNKPEFDMAVPVSDLPSGTAGIEVVGVGKDGVLYPAETISVRITNYRLNALAASNQHYRDLQSAIAAIGRIDQEIEYWYTRACNEPNFVTFTSGISLLATDGFARVASLTYLNSFTVPGRTADYLGRCRAAIVKRAQARLQIGKLYKQLGRFDAARAALEQVVQEAGESSGVGAAALEELRGL